MFKDIETLEKEIQTFHKNILASKELLGAMEGLLDTLKQQNKSIDLLTKEQQEKMDTHLSSLKSLTRATAEDVAEKCRQTEEALTQSAKALQSEIKAQNKVLLEETAQSITQICREYTQALKTAKEEHINTLNKLEKELKSTKEELHTTYLAFLERLEKTNVDQIFKTCKEMQKSLEQKLWIVAGGVGVSVLLTLLSLFIR